MTTVRASGVGMNMGERRWLVYTSTDLLSPCSASPSLPKHVTSLASSKPNHKHRASMASTLLQLLGHVAQDAPGKKMIIYRTPLEKGPVVLSYNSLSRIADERGIHLLPHFDMKKNKVIFLHLNDHYLSIVYFWAIIAAGGIPCLSTQVSKDGVRREENLTSILKRLDNPLIITTAHLVADFVDLEGLHLKTIEDLEATPTHLLEHRKGRSLQGYRKSQDDVAVLLLTSGSTGSPKAVALTHRQILHAVVGKSQLHHTTEDDVFLNWTGFDHVANLTEIHLHALSLGADQVHLPGSAVLADPTVFLDKISSHKVSYTFAPNFFLASLVDRLHYTKPKPSKGKENVCPPHHRSTSAFQIPNRPKSNGENRGPLPKVVCLSSLRALISGGESNMVTTCEALTKLLQHLGARKSFIRPGFGMTETCAGAIYNTVDCPVYDVGRKATFACLGECIPGIQYRIWTQDGFIAKEDEVGELQVKGDVVFKCYYNDKCSTMKSFTEDGWFRTGDRGFKDPKGRLHLTGRDNDMIVING